MANTTEDVSEILIERLKQYAANPNEFIEPLRSVAARLHSRSASQDKIIREKTLERISKGNNEVFSLLISTMEIIRDPMTTASLAGIIHESVSPKGYPLEGKNRKGTIAQLIALNATESMVRLIIHHQNSNGQLTDTLLIECICVLSQLSQKDPKFATKIRLSGGVKPFHTLLRTYFNNTKIVIPLLLIIKALVKNGNTIQPILKDNILSTLEKVLLSIGFSPSPKLRIVLHVISLISKYKNGQTRILKTGNLINLLLKIFERWERYDGRTRLKICANIITTIHKIISLKTGRLAVVSQGGLPLLYKFCTNCPDDKAYDATLTHACAIIGHCIDKLPLPIDQTRSPAKFQISLNCSDTIIDQTAENNKNPNLLRDSTPESDDEEESTPDEENLGDDIVVDEPAGDPGTTKSTGYIPLTPQMRDVEDLKLCYQNHFKEMNVNNEIYLQEMNTSTKEINCNNQDLNATRFKPLSGEFIIRSCKYGNIVPNPGESMIQGLPAIEGLGLSASREQVYNQIASRVCAVIPLVKVAFPDMVGSPSYAQPEPLNIKDRRVCRAKLLRSIDRGLHPGLLMHKIVYDLDLLIASNNSQENQKNNEKEKSHSYLTNKDLEYVTSNPTYFGGPLHFESRFESGNLRKAIQVTANGHEYDLVVMPDINSTRHHQWFYFEVTNMEANKPYIFNIVNCEKHASQFNFGMRPVVFSVLDWERNKTGWIRAGTDICYFRNSYTSPGNKRREYLTATFTITFPYASDVVYIAYHYPYTYSQLLTSIWNWSTQVEPTQIIYRAESLCLTLNNNDTPVITITAPNTSSNPIESREIIFLTGRVHPGESNASWVMLGTLMNLLSNSSTACWLRSTYVFKVVPMLNPEGVINGCYRCGLSDEDLNRRWSHPNKNLHPVIFHSKGLMQYSVRVLNKVPYVYCDFHGHSRRKNVFLYGCCNEGSWWEVDKETKDNPVDFLMLPNLLQHLAPAFAMHLSSFKVEKARESTARVCVWREFKVKRSYTMETSYCGFDQGRYDGLSINTWHLQEMGSHLCQALACLRDETSWRMNMMSKNIHDPRYDLNTPRKRIRSNDDESSESNSSEMHVE